MHISNVEYQLDATITVLLIFQSAQHVSGNFLPILRSARLCFTACGIMHSSCCRPVAWNAEALTVRCEGCCSTVVEQHPS
jgi:hypothetical protein